VKRRPALLRRAPSLVSYWRDDRLIFENYLTGTRVSGDPLTCEVLHFFARGRSVDSAAAHFSDFNPKSVRAAVAALEHDSLLERVTRTADARAAGLAAWTFWKWNPAAGFLHFSTKDVRYRPAGPALGRALQRLAKTTPVPPSFKRYPGASQTRLPPAATGGSFPETLLARRTWRRFARRALPLSDLATLLGLTWGVQDWIKLPIFGKTPLKTSPSGGARHSIEVYVVALRVDGLPPGIYHYAADRHRLERVKKGATPKAVARYLPTQPWTGTAAALVIMTSVFARVQWKYHFPRAYRVVLAEAGHLCQTFCLTATWLGLAPFCTMALADSLIERDLGIDGVTESVVYVAGVGARPNAGAR
jgi:SagB-type dehydrogenase family enzyme